MRHFCYTVRDGTGAIKKGTLEASDRAGALAELNRRGVVPLSVTEGTSDTRAGGEGLKRLWIPGLVLLVLGILAFGWFSSNPIAGKRSKARSATKEKSTKGLSQTKKGQVQQNTTPDVTSYAEQKVDTGTAAIHEHQTVSGSSGGEQSISESPTNGVSDAERNHGTLRTQTEQVLRMVESVEPGTLVPPPPPIGNVDFMRAMTNTIVIAETDSPELADRKEKIAWLKQDIAQFVKEGYTPDDVVKVMVEHKNEMARMRTECMTYISDLYKAGQDEEALKFMEEANVELEKLGIRPLAHPRARKLQQQLQQP
jgi:hypothetical protein